MGHMKNYSESTARQIDDEIRQIVTDNYARTRKILLDNQQKLIEVSEALLERENMDGKELRRIVFGVETDADVEPSRSTMKKMRSACAASLRRSLTNMPGPLRPFPSPAQACGSPPRCCPVLAKRFGGRRRRSPRGSVDVSRPLERLKRASVNKPHATTGKRSAPMRRAGGGSRFRLIPRYGISSYFVYDGGGYRHDCNEC
jgi:hypothetical protein